MTQPSLEPHQIPDLKEEIKTEDDRERHGEMAGEQADHACDYNNNGDLRDRLPACLCQTAEQLHAIDLD
jgi:hypothetical protein